jgi:Spy/CpxP family protein refolding chaperone
MRTMRSHTARFAAAAGLLMLVSLDAAAQQRVDTSRVPRTPNAGARARQGMPAGTPGGTMQGPARGMRARAGGMEQGPAARGMRQGGNPAAQMLRMRQQLNLTDEQVRKLETLAKADAPRGNAADALRARADLMEATQGDGNLSAARAALDKMSRLRNEQVVAGLKQRQDARAVLTADQRRMVDNARQRASQRVRAVAKREGAMRQQRGVRGGRGVEQRFRGPQFRGPQFRGPQFRGQPMRGPQFQGQPMRGPQVRGRVQPVPPVPPVDAAPPANLDVDNFPPMH